MSLRLDWCNREAALYACKRWHYSRCMPAFKTVKIGVWEDGHFIGAIIFGCGAAPQAHRPYGILNTEIAELCRVALGRHKAPVTKIVAIALKMLKKQSPKLKLIVSYADPEKGHHGGIYQGGNWVFVGATSLCEHFEDSRGKRIHSKTLKTGRRGYATKLLAAGKIKIRKTWKYKYLFPLNTEMAAKVAKLGKPYPKRAGSKENVAAGHQPAGGGVTPTPALQTRENYTGKKATLIAG